MYSTYSDLDAAWGPSCFAPRNLKLASRKGQCRVYIGQVAIGTSEPVCDEDVAGFCFDLSESGTVRDVGVYGDVGVGRVETFTVGIEGFGYAWMLERNCQ